MADFRRKRFLFLGYGLGDWNLRVMLKNLKTALASPLPGSGEGAGVGPSLRSWAIQHKPTEIEQFLWRSRNVNIHDMRIDDFVSNMAKEKNA